VVSFTLLWFWARYIPRRDWTGTFIHIGVIILSIAAGIFFFRSHARTLRGNPHQRLANLKDASFTEANLQNANLILAELQKASLMGANLRGAHLIQANLQGASLVRASLENAILSGANLQEVDFQYSNLKGVDLSAADLRGAKYLTQVQLDMAYGDTLITKLPPGLTFKQCPEEGDSL